MKNPYYGEFQDLRQNHTYKGQQWFGHRRELVEKYSWAVPNDTVIQYITKAFDEIAEIGAGEGYWARLLSENGATVHAFDPDTDKTWYDVQRHNARSVKKSIENNPVLMVWPPVNDDLAKQVLDYGPSHMLYVGEPSGGCTANDAFFEKLNREYGPIGKVEIPSYEGIDDNLYHYARNI